MGSTFKCYKCDFTVRVSVVEELEVYQKDHNILCDRKLESIWKNYDKMSNEEKEKKSSEVIFKYGVIKGEK